MNQLVFIENQQAVTTSLQVARSFDKLHKDVLESIDTLIKGVAENPAYSKSPMFYEGTYEHTQNKQQYRMFYMNRDGFTLLAMGFTGQKAINFKLAYIQAFNEMEEQLKVNFTLPEDPLELALQTSLKNYQEIKVIKEDVSLLKDTMRIDGRQEFTIKSHGKSKVMETLGGYNSPAYNALSKKVFSRMWRDFNNHFILPRSTDLPKIRFDEALKFIAMWRPDTSTAMEIESHNNQTKLKLI